ncbi:MAG TPA: hypothetical protein VHT03_15905 [Rhizomicrobium sp.]|jgi:hypothetical protein|nr:hypothetical protein [Rhizomicrobium sp.]
MKALICGAMLCAVVAPCSALAESPIDGTWKADLSSAQMPKKPDIFVLKDGMYSCKTCTPAYTIKADGTDQAVKGNPYLDTIAIKVVDPNTIEETDKKNGKVVTTSKVTVAPDGKTDNFEFTDSSNTNAAPVTGKGAGKKIAAGPAGSHAVSGSWITTSFQSMSDNGVTVTYKTEGDMLSMTNPTGQSYTAKLNGADVPYKGDPGTTSVNVKMMGKTLVETDKRDGKVISRVRSTVSKDGKSMSVAYYDALHDRTTHFMATKQ